MYNDTKYELNLYVEFHSSDDSLPHQNNNAKSTAIWYHLPKKGDSRKEGNSQQKDFENNRNDAVPNLLTTVTNTEKEENAGTGKLQRLKNIQKMLNL